MIILQDINRLLRVCELGDESGLQLLLDSGYEVNSQDENGTTPLHVAAANDHVSKTPLNKFSLCSECS